MSRSQGVLYHILPTVNTRRGWKETESSNPPDCIYEGEIENGLPHGIGTYTKTDGATYVGHFKNGLRHGKELSLGLKMHQMVQENISVNIKIICDGTEQFTTNMEK